VVIRERFACSRRALSRVRLAVFCSAALALLAATVLPAAAASDRLSIRLDWITHPPHAAIFLAMERGWFKAADLDVTVEDGNGSTTTVQIVGGGNFDLGHADLAPMAIAKSRGFPVISIAGFIRKGGVGFVVPKATKITTLDDFIGKEIYYTAGSFEGPLVEPLFRTHGVPFEKINLVNIDGSAKIPAYLSGKADAMITTVPPNIVIAEGKRDSYGVLFSDYGFNLPSFGLFARTDTLQTKGDAIKRFVSIVCAAWTYIYESREHEIEAAKATRVQRPNSPLSEDMLVAQTESYRGNLYTEATAKLPIGLQSEADWAVAIKSMEAAKVIAPGSKPADYFTNDYIDLGYAKTIVEAK
jgi:NitT/TauT family transport system substrate-binding protein